MSNGQTCEECGGEECLYFYFKNAGKRSIRTTSIYCPNCFPDSQASASPTVGEVEVDPEVAQALLAAGWREDCAG